MKQFLCDDALDEMPMHIRKSAINPAVAETEFLVVDAEQVKNRGVKIIACGRVLHGFP